MIVLDSSISSRRLSAHLLFLFISLLVLLVQGLSEMSVLTLSLF